MSRLTRKPGPKHQLTQTQVHQNIRVLTRSKAHRDLALFTLGIDSLLRGSDLLDLRVVDVMTAMGEIAQTVTVRQHKTGRQVEPVLTDVTRKALAGWIGFAGLGPTDYLFTRLGHPHGPPLSTSTFRRLIKKWASSIGLDPAIYSGHSLRRTKAIFMYRRGVSVEDIARLLGHTSTASTLHYLGITTEHVQAQALAHDIFAAPTPPPTKGLSDEDIDRIATRLSQILRNPDT